MGGPFLYVEDCAVCMDCSLWGSACLSVIFWQFKFAFLPLPMLVYRTYFLEILILTTHMHDYCLKSFYFFSDSVKCVDI